jgi:hypothetical protein
MNDGEWLEHGNKHLWPIEHLWESRP